MNLRLIDKQLVHKQLAENIFISEVRKPLPQKIVADVFEKNLLPDEKDYLSRFFHFHRGGNAYILRTATVEVKKKIDRFLEAAASSEDERDYLGQVTRTPEYNAAEETGCILNDTVSEMVETKILNILGLRQLHITDRQRLEIYGILEKIPGINWRNDLFYSRMHVDTGHSFFFEHPNEHVPGMMLIEAIRQFGIACSHCFLNVPSEGVQFVLSDIGIRFYNYLELAFPVKFEGRLNSTKYNKSGDLTYSDFTTEVFQKNQAVAQAKIIGKNLSNDLFDILRRSSENPGDCPWFIPRTPMEITIFASIYPRDYQLEILNLSAGGFCVKSPGPLKKLEITGFQIHSPLGPIGEGGKAELIWEQDDGDRCRSGFKITALHESDRRNLERVLKIYCFVDEEEEIF